MIRILMRVDRGQVWLYVLLISPRRRLRYDDACAETKVLLDAGQPLTPGKSESESPGGGKHRSGGTSNSFDRVREKGGGCWE